MHSLRMNCLESLGFDFFRSGFLGMIKIGDAQLDIEENIMPATSNCLISWSIKSQYLRGNE